MEKIKLIIIYREIDIVKGIKCNYLFVEKGYWIWRLEKDDFFYIRGLLIC